MCKFIHHENDKNQQFEYVEKKSEYKRIKIVEEDDDFPALDSNSSWNTISQKESNPKEPYKK